MNCADDAVLGEERLTCYSQRCPAGPGEQPPQQEAARTSQR